MRIDEETLLEIEDYVKALEESVGLKLETMHDINRAINEYRKKLCACCGTPCVLGYCTNGCDDY